MTHTHPQATVIMASVAASYGLTLDALQSRLQSTDLAAARREACYRAYASTEASSAEIGSLLNRHHSTVNQLARRYAAAKGLPLPAGLTRDIVRDDAWSDADDRTLASVWADATVPLTDAIRERLPHRTFNAAQQRAHLLGLRRPQVPHRPKSASPEPPAPLVEERCELASRDSDRLACDRLLYLCLKHHWNLAPAGLRRRVAALVERAA